MGEVTGRGCSVFLRDTFRGSSQRIAAAIAPSFAQVRFAMSDNRP
jgi:hypothetical protein